MFSILKNHLFFLKFGFDKSQNNKLVLSLKYIYLILLSNIWLISFILIIVIIYYLK